MNLSYCNLSAIFHHMTTSEPDALKVEAGFLCKWEVIGLGVLFMVIEMITGVLLEC